MGLVYGIILSYFECKGGQLAFHSIEAEQFNGSSVVDNHCQIIPDWFPRIYIILWEASIGGASFNAKFEVIRTGTIFG